MNTVTFETAKALRDAGFPQPESVAKGQYWYSANGGTDMLFSVVSFPEETTKTVKKKGWIFAPQAHDILEQLAKDVYPNLIRADISSYNNEFPKQVQAPQFCIYSLPDNQLSVLQFEFQTNPHEAAAKAYLQLHKPA